MKNECQSCGQCIDPKLKNAIDISEVILITGKRGSGKSAMLYYILEQSPHELKYVIGLHEQFKYLLPDTIDILPLSVNTINDLPAHADIAIDESAFYFYAHDSGTILSKVLSKIIMNARKKDEKIGFATHTMRKFLIGAILDVDTIIFKEPSILHSKFERKEILELVKIAKKAFEELHVSKQEKKKYGYLLSEDHEGMIQNELPSFWSEELSNALSPAYDDGYIKQDNGKWKKEGRGGAYKGWHKERGE